MALAAPSADEVLDFQFKLHCRLKIFDNEDSSVFGKPCSLVAAASRYGLIFVGNSAPNFKVLSLQNIEQISEKKADVNDYLRRTINLPSRPTHLSVNSDCTLLCVAIEKESCPTALIYNVASFATQKVTIIREIRLSATPGVFIVEVNWNPTISTVLTVCKSDKTLGLYEFKDAGVEINELPSTSGATCMCWSPKGKQLAVGGIDGKITQYKPDLKPVKSIGAPQLEGGHTVLALQWVSNYQFIAVYGSLTDTENRANLVVVDAPKTGQVKYTNYEDICYSYGSTRPIQFYMVLQPAWNVLMVASSNSMELGILGMSKEQQWTQWILGDAARAELPLSPKKQDTLPVGLAVDTGSVTHMPWGEHTLPSAPFLYLMSHHGVLCCFHIVNVREGAPPVCQAPENLELKYFTKESAAEDIKENIPVSTSKVTAPILQQQQQEPQILTQKPIEAAVQPHQPFLGSTVTKSNLSPSQPLFGTATGSIQQTTTVPSQSAAKIAHQFAAETVVKQGKAEAKAAVSVTPTSSATVLESVPSVPKIDAETEKLISKMTREECVSLESELKAILHKAKSLKISLGSDSEGTELVKNTEILQDFLEEVTETSTAQAAEIHTLKQKLLQSWAWFEDARSRLAISKDPAMAALIRTQPLDAASRQHLDEMKYLLYYLESQLTQANNTLDEQWENFQDSCKRTYRSQMPTMETIYQAMVRQTATVQKQNYILKDIAARLRKHNSTNSSVALLVSLENADRIAGKLKDLQLQPQDLMQVEYERVLKKQRHFTAHKAQKLQELFADHKPRVARIVKPQVAPLKLTPQKSIFSANVSPVVPSTKEPFARVLDFMQSTPKLPTSVPPVTPPSTPLSALKTEPFDFNTRIFAVPKASAVEAKPQGSAFAPTTQPPFSAQKLTAKPTQTTVAQSPATLFNITAATTKPTFNFAPTATAEPAKFSFAAIPTTVSSKTTAADSVFSTFRISTSAVPTSQVSLFAPGAGAAVSSPGIIKPTAKAAVAPIASFVVPAQEARNVTSFLQSAQASTQGSLFAKPNERAFNPTQKLLSDSQGNTVTSSQAPAPMFSFFKGGATTNKDTAVVTTVAKTSAPLIFGSAAPATVTTAAPVFGLKPQTKTSQIFGGAAPVTTHSNVTATTAVITTPTTTVASIFKPAQPSTFTELPATTTVAPIFSSAAATTTIASGASAFDAAPTTTATTNLFGVAAQATTSPTAVFSNTTAATVATTSGSIFGGAPVSTTASTLGLVPIAASATTTTTTTSLFGSIPAPAMGSIFSSASAGSVAVTSPTPATTAASIFGAATPATTITSGITTATAVGGFGTAPTTTVSTLATFGVTPATSSPAATTATGVFGSAAPSAFITTATTPAAFGTTTSTFGAAPATTQNVFGSTAVATTTNAFGSPTTTAAVFGSPPAAATTSSVFGTPPVSTAGSIFGGSSAFGSPFSQKAPVFGGPAASSGPAFDSTPVFASTASAFGSTTTPSTTSASAFGQPAAFGSGSLFGTPVSTSGKMFGGGAGFGGSIFGKPAVTGAPTSAPAFGSAASSSFSFANAAANSSSGFGKPAGSFGGDSSSFSFGSLNVSTTTAANSGFGSGFGQTQSPTNPFGRTDASKPAFGSSGGSIFGSPAATSSGSVFGASTFGGSPATLAGAPAFGSSPTFGQPAFGQGTFASSAFGSPAQTSGPFSGGGQSVGQTGFGGGAFQSSPGGFGGPPVFGSGSSPGGFGAGPAFGATPSFGSTPAFGSPGKPFGSSSLGSGTFASTGNQQNQTFGNLASQSTLGFGSLAQQSQTPSVPQQTAFGSGSSFSSWR